jgi:hypothetical protein
MNRGEIFQLLPGPAMNELIAEKVMGLEKCSNAFCRQYHLEDGSSMYAPEYSRDMNLALKVVKKLAERGFAFHLTYVTTPAQINPVLVSFNVNAWTSATERWIEPESVALAICQLALIIIEEK